MAYHKSKEAHKEMSRCMEKGKTKSECQAMMKKQNMMMGKK